MKQLTCRKKAEETTIELFTHWIIKKVQHSKEIKLNSAYVGHWV